MKKNNIKNIALTLFVGMTASTVHAATIGDDFNLKLSPASAGMGGVGYVSPQDAVASVYGNPASLTQLEGNTDFTFGATYLNVRNKSSGDSSALGAAWGGDIEFEHYLLPSIAFRQRVSEKFVLGGGIQVISGLGSDYRSSNALQPTITYINFGANVAAGYQLTPKTSIGATLTTSYALLELGLVSNTAIQEDIGFRAGLGVIHDFGLVKAGLNYNSELAMKFDDVIRTSPGTMSNVDMEQPQELILGISNTPELWKDVLLEANLIYKNWENADLHKDIYKDTYTLQLGGQYTVNEKLELRAGYSYTTDLLKENDLGNSLGGITSLEAGGNTVPIGPEVLQFVQSFADPFWNNQVTVGLGYEFTETLGVDVHAGYAWGRDLSIGVNNTEVENYTLGGGLTWRF
tara:strand:- start:6828 stop:8036 length:1209 start_codon:yes stop_codon:yes gene_type:complete